MICIFYGSSVFFHIFNLFLFYWFYLLFQLCTSLDTANQLVQCTNTNVASLLEKVEELQKIVKRGDSAIAAAKAFYVAPDNHNGSFKWNKVIQFVHNVFLMMIGKVFIFYFFWNIKNLLTNEPKRTSYLRIEENIVLVLL